MKRIFLSILVIGTLLLSGCSAPSTAPTSVPEPAIPEHLTAYTDETGLFSISYPQDWELGLSRLELRQSAKDIIEAFESDTPVEGPKLVFLAGLPTETGSSPNVNIVVASLPEGRWTPDDVVEAFTRTTEEFIPDYYEFSRVKTTIGGREAIIMDYEGTLAGLIKGHYLLMVTLVGKTTWTVTCSALPGDFSKWEDDLNTIVRSLRVLK